MLGQILFTLVIKRIKKKEKLDKNSQVSFVATKNQEILTRLISNGRGIYDNLIKLIYY